jgi:hypothetical protein
VTSEHGVLRRLKNNGRIPAIGNTIAKVLRTGGVKTHSTETESSLDFSVLGKTRNSERPS